MRNRLTAKMWTLLGAALMVLAAASSARADEAVVAKVPFDFVVSGVELPAGTYEVTRMDDLHMVWVASTDRRHSVFVLTNPLSPEDAGPNPELEFKRYGGQYFLSRIVADESQGSEIFLPAKLIDRKAERVAIAATGNVPPHTN